MIGRPRFFDIDIYLSVVEGMINADEVERAFWMLKNPPAFYRKYPPKRLLEIKERLHRQVWTPVQYKGIYEGAKIDVENQPWPLRAQKLEEIIRANNGGLAHVMELAPGGHWLAEGLKHKGLRFTYESLGLDGEWAESEKPGPKFGDWIFCAFEIIEHLSNEWEIYQNYLKFNKPADIVMLSTPLFTYGGGMDNWQSRELGHLRTYTPEEFHSVANQMFSGFQWHCLTDDTILLIGRRV
jgi:hypothetical protein